jgi:surface polysaccharide O-acyltransferase-like enzyme
VEIVTLLQVGAFFSGVAGQWLIAKKSMNAFLAWTVSNVLLIGFSVATHAWWLLAMYVVYLVGSLLAWRQWYREQARSLHGLRKIKT